MFSIAVLLPQSQSKRGESRLTKGLPLITAQHPPLSSVTHRKRTPEVLKSSIPNWSARPICVFLTISEKETTFLQAHLQGGLPLLWPSPQPWKILKRGTKIVTCTKVPLKEGGGCQRRSQGLRGSPLAQRMALSISPAS